MFSTLQPMSAQMATRTIASSKPARQLGELLQEQQEPFILAVYLSERGCTVRKNLHLGDNFIGRHGNSGKLIKKSGSQNKSKKGTIPNFPKVLKVVCNKFFTIKVSRTKNSDGNEGGNLSVSEMDRNNQEDAERDRFSSATSTTVYNSCSDSDVDEPSMFADNPKSLKPYNNEGEKKAAAGKKLQWSCMEDSKRHSPVSVLEEISTSRDNTRSTSSARQKCFFLPKLIKEDSILSASLWNLLLQSTPEKSTCTALTKLQDPDHLSNSSSFSISKRVLQQTKQLLFDCVRELVDSHEKKEAEGKEYLGSEEIGTFICEKIKAWGKQCGDESNIKQLLETDVLDSKAEWSDYESQKRDIGLLIGNVILDEITSEVVKDLIN